MQIFHLSNTHLDVFEVDFERNLIFRLCPEHEGTHWHCGVDLKNVFGIFFINFIFNETSPIREYEKSLLNSGETSRQLRVDSVFVSNQHVTKRLYGNCGHNKKFHLKMAFKSVRGKLIKFLDLIKGF